MENKIKLVAPKEADVDNIRFQGEDIEVKRILSFEEMLGMIHEIVEGSFDDDGSYQPELTDLYYKKETIEDYTNIELPINPTEIYSLIYNTDIYDKILEVIDLEQHNEIKRAFERKIGYLVRTNERNYANSMEKMVKTLEGLGEKFENVFSDVNPEEVSKFFGVINDKGIDEEKIVKAYIDEKKDDE